MNECPQNWKPSDTAFVFDIDVVVVVAVVVFFLWYSSEVTNGTRLIICYAYKIDCNQSVNWNDDNDENDDNDDNDANYQRHVTYNTSNLTAEYYYLCALCINIENLTIYAR